MTPAGIASFRGGRPYVTFNLRRRNISNLFRQGAHYRHILADRAPEIAAVPHVKRGSAIINTGLDQRRYAQSNPLAYATTKGAIQNEIAVGRKWEKRWGTFHRQAGSVISHTSKPGINDG
jgi:hypothetical protein